MLNSVGQMRTVEAFLAILLLFSAFSIATLMSPAPTIENADSLTTIGIQTLVSIDNDGTLGKLIDERNWTALSEALDASLHVGTSYNLTVYDTDLETMNDVLITNGLISSGDVVSFQYPCASPTSADNYYLLQLQLATAR